MLHAETKNAILNDKGPINNYIRDVQRLIDNSKHNVFNAMYYKIVQ